MRPFVESLITEEIADRDGYARTVLDAIRQLVPQDESIVPEDSLIREFIPGGKYEDIY